MSIVVVGSINADLVMQASRAPDAGETLTGRNFTTGVGGKGLNQCAAIALQSRTTVSMVACIGADTYGEMCTEAMRTLGINYDHVKQFDDISTGVALIVVEDSGDNRILLSAGANEKLSVDLIDQSAGLIQDAAIAVFQLESPLKTVLHAIKLAHNAGVKTILNPAPAIELPDELLAQVSYLIPNESEAALLAKQAVRNADEAIEAGKVLLDRGVQDGVIITLGAAGCVIVTKEGSKQLPATKVIAIDTTA